MNKCFRSNVWLMLAIVLTAIPLSASAEDASASVGPFPAPTATGTGTSAPTPAASRAPTTQYDAGDPTADEQYVLELINRARANPTAEGTRLGITITEGMTAADAATVQVRPPMAMNKILLTVARAHSQDMHDRQYFAHVNPDGKDPFQRMTAGGYTFTVAGENIATSSGSAASVLYTAAQLEDLLMVDPNYPDRGHRVNLLDADSGTANTDYREVGLGFYKSSAAPFDDFLTQDFGTSTTGPFIVGVVYDDKNGNNFYDIGEGLSGVTVMPDSGTYFAVTSTTGGYAIPVAASGSMTLTVSGGSYSGTGTKTLTLSTSNQKADFISGSSGGPGGPGGPGGTTGSSSTVDTDSDGFPDEIETALGTSPSSATSTPFGGSSAGAANSLNVLKMMAKMNFVKTLSDSISLSGTLPVPDNFVVLNQQVVLDVGGVVRTFVLDAKGKSPTGTTESFKVKVKSVKGGVAAQTSPFSAKLSKGNYSTSLSDEGLTGDTDASKTVMVPVIILFNLQKYSTTLSKAYTAKAHKSGMAK